jgi:hypothetical protein
MAVFVHLTGHRNVASLKRSGITISKKRSPRGVYAVPVTPNYYVSHQWLRELRRGDSGSIVGVYFRVPDDESCLIGHYSSPHVQLTADEAVGVMMSLDRGDAANSGLDDSKDGATLPDSTEGFEVVFQRRIKSKEILRVAKLPQVVGWRFSPDSKGRRPCVCLCCSRGDYGIRKLLNRVEQAEAKGEWAKPIVFGREDDSFERVERLKSKEQNE